MDRSRVAKKISMGIGEVGRSPAEEVKEVKKREKGIEGDSKRADMGADTGTEGKEGNGGNNGAVYIGIDPGVKGGLASLMIGKSSTNGQWGRVIEVASMPPTDLDILHWLQGQGNSALLNNCKIWSMLERVSGNIWVAKKGGGGGGGGGDGGNKSSTKDNVASSHTMFTLGESFGKLEMALVAGGIPQPFGSVVPIKWQHGLGILPRRKSESTVDWKNRLKGIAQTMYPEHGKFITKATCDALLIATYLQRRYEGWIK